jgi:argininosuccinate lyase
MMPQKKNPDSLELIRGKSGRLIGNYVKLATTLKGLGLTYFKDLQEDKEPFFDSAHHLQMVLKVFAQVLLTLKVREDNIERDLDPFLLATDMADYLVRKGLPFRQAHKAIGRLVGYCVDADIPLTEVSLSKLREFSDMFDEDVAQLYSWERSVDSRTVAGGAGSQSVRSQIEAAERAVNKMNEQKALRIVEQAGAVLFREIDGEFQVLTVRSKTFPDQRIFPKGHIEEGEAAEAAAARELLEEGGMAGSIAGYAGLREFVFKNKKYRVRYYAAKYVSKDNEGEPNRDPQWMTVAQTRDILPFDDLKDVLDKSAELIGRGV